MIRIITLLTLLLNSMAFTAPFHTMTPRSIGMGGTGVASSIPSEAPIYNPALLSHFDADQNFSMAFPSLSGQFTADPDSITVIRDLQGANMLNKIANALNAIPLASPDNIGPITKNATQNITSFNNNLLILDNKSFNLALSGIFSLTRPKQKLAIGFYSNVSIAMDVSPQVSGCDIATFNGYIELMNLVADVKKINRDTFTFNVECSERKARVNLLRREYSGTLQIINPILAKDDQGYPLLQSSAEIAAAMIIENGLSISNRNDYKHLSLSIGFTPKHMQITSIYANPDIHDIDSGSFSIENIWENHRKKESSINLDIGLALSLHKMDALKLGLVIKNLIPRTFQTMAFTQTDGEQYTAFLNLQTQARAGFSLDLPWGFHISADLDLFNNKPYFYGLNTQYLAVGTELDLLHFIQLRAGGRINLQNTLDRSFSLGLGLHLLALHFDLAGHIGDNKAGVAAQLGIAF